MASGWRLHKCSSKEHLPQDRISQLPHDILICILSFLTFKEAARTSVLSKRWKDVSKYLASLDFDGSEVLDKIVESERKAGHASIRERETRKYVKRLNKVLQSHKATVLDEFRVHFELDNSYQKAIDKWLQFAFARKVQSLELDLYHGFEFDAASVEPFTFPNVTLGLTSEGSSGGWSRAYFKSLKSLTLSRVEVSEEVLQFFLHNCRSLERLVVRRSYNLISLEVSAPSPALKYLETCHCFDLQRLTVTDANLVSLKTNASILVLKNVQMLVEIHLFSWFTKGCRAVTSQLSCCLSNLEVLSFCIRCREVIELEGMLDELPQLPKLKQLTLRVSPKEDESLLGLTRLTKASPNLEKLVIKLDRSSEGVRNRRKLEEAADYPLQHLKVFELSGYFGRTCEVELVKFFSKNAINLERIIIDPDDFPHLPKSPQELKKQQVSRRHAKRHLKGLVPPNVELDIR